MQRSGCTKWRTGFAFLLSNYGGKAYKALSDENSALEAELQTAKDASKEKIADRLKYGKTEQELCELHALIDNIPPEIVAAYRRKTTGLQNER